MPNSKSKINPPRPETRDQKSEVARILEERARQLAQVPEASATAAETIEIAAFHLGSEYLGIPTPLVIEIQPLRAHNWSHVPCAPGFILGVINLRGHIYSIVDLARFVGLPPRPLAEKAHILLVRGGHGGDGKEMELTLLADDVPEVRQVPLANLNSPPGTISAQMQDYLRGITPDMLMVMNLERLLSDPRLIVHEEA